MKKKDKNLTGVGKVDFSLSLFHTRFFLLTNKRGKKEVQRKAFLLLKKSPPLLLTLCRRVRGGPVFPSPSSSPSSSPLTPGHGFTFESVPAPHTW